MQTLTELRLALVNLQSRILGLQGELDECVTFIDTLTGGIPIILPKGLTRGRPRKIKTNGSAGKAITAEAFRRQVREHYATTRRKSTRKPAAMDNPEEALERARRKYPNVPDPSPDTVTTHEAAEMIGLSDSGTRLLYGSKLPRPTKELRRWGRSGRFNPAMVIPRRAVEAYLSGNPEPVAGGNKGYKNTVRSRREQTARLLKRFDRVKPRPIPKDFSPQGISVLVQHGYLEGKGTGYIRTNKEFRVDLGMSANGKAKSRKATPTTRPQKKYYGSATKARRERTAKYLNLFDRNEPRDATALGKQAGMAPTSLGSLVRRGYLQKRENGYVRSGAEFTV